MICLVNCIFHLTGPHDGTAENGTVAASRTAIAVGSDIAYASTLYLRSREDEHFRGMCQTNSSSLSQRRMYITF